MSRCSPFFRVQLLLASFLFTVVAWAQQPSGHDSIPRTVLESLAQNSDSLRALQFTAGPLKFVPFIAPSYTPEMKFLLTAGGLITFAVDRKDKHLLRSSIPFSIGKSTNGSLQVSIKGNIYFKEDRWRLTGEIWHKDMPDNYYGIGYTSARTTPRSDSTSLYHRDWKRMYGKVVRQVRPKFFLGGIYDATKTKATDLNPVMQEDASVLKYGTVIKNRGLGLVVEYDSRDVPVNAYTGVFLDLSVTSYNEVFGGQYNFVTVDLDYRQYKPVGHRKTLAWELRSRNNRGDVPWTDLSQIGTPWDLRGYTWGQYRDELMVYGIVEYRHMFDRKRPDKKGSLDSRFGFVTWLGTGAVGQDLKSLPGALPNAGVGLRFETESRSNVRIDYGIGVKSSALYVTFYEAF